MRLGVVSGGFVPSDATPPGRANNHNAYRCDAPTSIFIGFAPCTIPSWGVRIKMRPGSTRPEWSFTVMSTSTKVSNGTKYRVAVRVIAVDNKWTYEQFGPIDRFSKGNVVIDVTYGPSNSISTAEKVAGNSHTLTGSTGKMFVVQEWLTGIKDPINPKTGKGVRFIRLTTDQVTKFESGKGIALIKAAEVKKETVTTTS